MPVVESTDFQTRLAMAIAAHTAPPSAASAPPWAPAQTTKPAPARKAHVGRAPEGRGGRTPPATRDLARLAYFAANGSLAEAAKATGLPNTTISSLAGRLGWRAELKGKQAAAAAEPAPAAEPVVDHTDAQPEPAPAFDEVTFRDMWADPKVSCLDMAIAFECRIGWIQDKARSLDLGPKAQPAPIVTPTARAPTVPQIITTTPKEVRAWLATSMRAGGLSNLQALDKVALLTHAQAIDEANVRRQRGGLPLFVFIGTGRA